MCSVSISRSAPATGMPDALMARMIDSNSAPRCRTRISMSPGRTAWRPSPSPTRSRRSIQVLTAAGDLPRQLDPRASLGPCVERRIPWIDLGPLVGLDQRPQLDQARRGLAHRLVDGRHRIGGQPGMGGRLPEHHVDRVEHHRHRPERVFQRHRLERQSGVGVGALEVAAHLRKGFRRRVLEREDRLLVVADREDRAPQRAARARASGELGDEALDDVPLLRAGVLRLVDQQMVDAEVELVVHPGRFDAVEHVAGVGDQIVVVEQAARGPFRRHSGRSPRSRSPAAPRCGRAPGWRAAFRTAQPAASVRRTTAAPVRVRSARSPR